MPFGPYILWPEMLIRSISIARTSTGILPTAWAASTCSSAPAAWTSFAAAAIGCEVRAIVKSLVFVTAEDRAVLALVNGAARADEDRLAALADTAAIRRATPDEVREHTGYAIGGTPPVARVGELPRFVDRTLLELDVVWGAAGTPRDVFPIAPQRLVDATGAQVVDLV